MRHAKKRHQLNRFTSWHKATLRSLVTNLIIHQTIKTTLARAKAVKAQADNLISLAKRNTLSAKREAYKMLCDHKLVKVLFEEIGPRFASRAGGYTRVLILGSRRGDNAKLAVLELSEIKKKEPKKAKKEKQAKAEQVRPEPGVREAKPEEGKSGVQETITKEKPPATKKPTKKFLGGIRNIFKKERDSL